MTETLVLAGLSNRRKSCVPATSLDKSSKQEKMRFRILVIGNNMVGKTSIIRFVFYCICSASRIS